MKYQSIVTRGEKISENEYKLITEHGFYYYYRCISADSEAFQKEDHAWKQHVLGGEKVLLDYIAKPEGESPAYIAWNYEGRAMLEVKVTTMFLKGVNLYGSEISSFDLKDCDDWQIDKNCPLPKNVPFLRNKQ